MSQPDGIDWFYVDRSGQEFGPFSTNKMKAWFSAGFFPIGDKLLVRTHHWARHVPVADLWPDGSEPFAGPPREPEPHNFQGAPPLPPPGQDRPPGPPGPPPGYPPPPGPPGGYPPPPGPGWGHPPPHYGGPPPPPPGYGPPPNPGAMVPYGVPPPMGPYGGPPPPGYGPPPMWPMPHPGYGQMMPYGYGPPPGRSRSRSRSRSPRRGGARRGGNRRRGGQGKGGGGDGPFKPHHTSSVPKATDLSEKFASHDGPPTTGMLRNIPNRYMQDTLLSEVDDAGFGGAYDFFYLPMDIRNNANVGYAFINFSEPDDFERFRKHFDGYSFLREGSKKIATVSPAIVQGLKANVQNLTKKRVTQGAFRPLVIRNGRRVDLDDAAEDMDREDRQSSRND